MSCERKCIIIKTFVKWTFKGQSKMTLEGMWLPSAGHFIIKMNIWEHKQLIFKGRWLVNRDHC